MSPKDDSYILEKTIWNENDFEQMGWHDAHIHGMAFGSELSDGTADLLFDIDYIFKWVGPIPPEKHFSFWVSPCTLVFEHAYDLKTNIEDKMSYAFGPFEIADFKMVERLQREGDFYGYKWCIELQTGAIELKSHGFKQYVRKKPILGGQDLTLEKRGGISFSKEFSES